MSHTFQHPDEPTWCIHCGTFKQNCRDEDCHGTPHRWDMATPEGNLRIAAAITGREFPQPESTP